MNRAFGRVRRLTAPVRGRESGGASAVGSGRSRAALRGLTVSLSVAAGLLLVAACAPDIPDAPDAPGQVAVAADVAAGQPLRDADLSRGEVLSYACRACHGLAAGEESPIGPSLAGVFGRRAASVHGFEYSRALRASGIVWSPEALDAWLAQPADFLPGNNMAFTGFRSAEDRRDLIAYLLEQTGPGAGP